MQSGFCQRFNSENQRDIRMAHARSRNTVILLIKKFIAELSSRNIIVTAAYLFGSYAWGSPDEWSDIDVAVITSEFQGDSFDFRYFLTKIAKDIDIDLEPHPFLEKEFDLHPFFRKITSQGLKIT